MDVYRPLRAGLFFYECLRLFLLVVFIFAASMGNGLNVSGFPYLAYLSSNALFPMMALFIWLRPVEHSNYLSLYMAGKIIALVTFYLWQIFSSRDFWGAENIIIYALLLWGSVIVSLTDMFSLWGAWALRNKLRRASSRGTVRSVDAVSSTENGGS